MSLSSKPPAAGINHRSVRCCWLLKYYRLPGRKWCEGHMEPKLSEVLREGKRWELNSPEEFCLWKWSSWEDLSLLLYLVLRRKLKLHSNNMKNPAPFPNVPVLEKILCKYIFGAFPTISLINNSNSQLLRSLKGIGLDKWQHTPRFLFEGKKAHQAMSHFNYSTWELGFD